MAGELSAYSKPDQSSHKQCITFAQKDRDAKTARHEAYRVTVELKAALTSYNEAVANGA
jgi:hypothetical protein